MYHSYTYSYSSSCHKWYVARAYRVRYALQHLVTVVAVLLAVFLAAVDGQRRLLLSATKTGPLAACYCGEGRGGSRLDKKGCRLKKYRNLNSAKISIHY